MKVPFVPEHLPLKNINWRRLISLIVEANTSLARYDGQLEGIPNPKVLLSPLMTQEAVLSSKIEGTVATLEDVLEYEANPTTEETELYKDIQEIINYRRTMMFAENYLNKRPICLNMLKEMHKILLEGVRGEKKSRGKFRTTQNYIAKPGVPLEEATYIPPRPEDLLQHLSTWEKYCHYDEEDKLVQLAVIHAQFEIIHPFLDGNGRIGRILIPLFLYDKKKLNSPMFYISSYMEATRDEYTSRLLAISEKTDWDGWITYFLKAIVEQAERNSHKTKNIMLLYEQMKDTVFNLTHSSYSIQTLDFLFHHPTFNVTMFTKESKMNPRTAQNIVKTLEAGKIIELIRKQRGRRPGVYIFPKLLEIVQR